ncbi:Molybdopterin-guanine dinucleotide biosynthesis protein MobA [hydrothermal vent metagenome]|uniref:Molybdopterin-guanine dinucleotide biosynthesis protein MobA n=1 Tax=hydrothermal vent metagenome TaxID=652676 RepID=A0A1W1BRM8_9ZZZZ
MKPYQTAVIFAGGKSRRMGKDKALLPFGDSQSLTHYQHTKLKKDFKDIYISAKKNKFDFPCKIIKDIYPESSPLVALLSIFKTLETKEVFVLSVDTPFIDSRIIQHIMETKREGADIIVAKSPKGIQPLCACYHRSIVPLLEAQYNIKNHKLTDLLHLANIKQVPFKEEYPFTNLNHPKEYNAALLSLTTH